MKPEDFGITDYEWVDGKLNVNGSVNLKDKKLKRLPFIFGVVTGDFNCTFNRLTSLKGAPEIVGENFYCNCNYHFLISLEGAPREVGGDFHCYTNQLTSLEGAPKEVNGEFDCCSNRLTSLKGAPREVGGSFACNVNQLTDLKGAPREVGRDFICNSNRLTSLKGAPREVGGDFSCENNSLAPLELIKTLYVDKELPEKYHDLADKIDPTWRSLDQLEKRGFEESSEDEDLLKALEKVSK